TALALPVRSGAALANLHVLLNDQLGGPYGLYDAVDYTRDRLPPGVARAVICSFMAHHQGMSLLALDNALNPGVMQRRFHQDPLVQSAELLLQERIPRDVPVTALPEPAEAHAGYVPRDSAPRHFSTPQTTVPTTQILSNGTYSLFVTNAGSGASWCGDLVVIRWREDVTC